MPVVQNYQQFGGVHWDTSSLQHVLAHYGATASNSQTPFSEAMLLGISGGVGVLYFTFEYEGYDPHLYLGTRIASPSDNPFDALCQRLGLNPVIYTTGNPSKAVSQLVQVLDNAQPAIVWANNFDLPYSFASGLGAAMQPVVVFGYDEAADRVDIADRAKLALSCTIEQLATARHAQPSLKHKLITIAPPYGELTSAIRAGLVNCINFMLHGPAKGPKANFGLAALQKWAALVADTKTAKGWAKMFPGFYFYQALKAVYNYIELNGTGGAAGRPMYADFLDEAALVLNQPELRAVAALFRASGLAWHKLGDTALLPDLQPFNQTKLLLQQQATAFAENGNAAIDEMAQMQAQLDNIEGQLRQDFPLTEAEVLRLREQLATQIITVYQVEKHAFEALNSVVN